MNRNMIGFLFFIVAIGIGFGALIPKIHAVREVSLVNKAKLQIAENKSKRKESLTALNKTFNEKKSDADAYLSVLPKEPEIPEVLVSIEAMGKENAINITSIVPQTDTKGQQVSVTLVGEGELTNLEKLMQAVAKSRRPMSVSTVVMTKKQTTQLLAFTMTVQFPYLSTTGGTDASLTPKTTTKATPVGSKIDQGTE